MKYIGSLFFFLFSLNLFGQLEIRPGIWQNSFQIKYKNGGYSYGGKRGESSIRPFIDFEYKLKRELDSTSTIKQLAFIQYLSVQLTVSFWNYTSEENGLNLKDDLIYSSIQSKYLSLPLVVKYRVQPGVLDDNLTIDWSVGAFGMYQLKSLLHEETTIFIRDQNNQITGEMFLEDTAELSNRNKKFTTGFCIGMTLTVGRLSVGFLAYQTFKDQYIPDIIADWNVPKEQSIYFQAHEDYSKMIFTGGGLTLGWKIN